MSSFPSPYSELQKRVLFAVILSFIALTTAYYGGFGFVAFWSVAGAIALYEGVSVAKIYPTQTPRFLLAAIVGAFGLMSFWSWTWSLLILALAVYPLLLPPTRKARLWGILGLLYALVLTAAPLLAREHPILGMGILFWMFAVVWTTDIGGYIVGRSIGGAKLWPSVSPNKTWSGFLGGVIAGTMAGLGVAAWFAHKSIPLPVDMLVVGVVSCAAAILSQGGDLAESAFKRYFKVKDSGWIIPGHGGVLDRLDGFWAVCFLVLCMLFLRTILAGIL
jgi:phosphatidate cytidylyltransferase